MGKLAGKVALVTGGSRGIGKGVATKLAQEGAALAISYVAQARQAEETVAAIKEHDVDGIAIQADSSDVRQIEHLVSQVMKHYGRLDILVSNAGIEHFATLEETRPEDFDRIFAVNTRGQFFAVQQAAKHMERGGRIVLSSSVSTLVPFARHAVYAASKGAVEVMVKNLAVDLGLRGITINAVAPGPVWTDMAKEFSGEYLATYRGLGLEDIIKIVTSSGRLGSPQDVAQVIAFLVSEDADWVTGQTIRVDGGAH